VKGKDYFPDALIRPLVEASAERDRKCAQAVGIEVPTETLRTVGRYNAQDYLFQRLYPVPEHQTVRAILDFGAGLGRTANLAFGAPGNTTEFMVTVDGIPSTYLTQRLYFQGLGLRFADYLDGAAEGMRFDVGELRRRCQLVHLPTWRMDLIPDASMDLVSCVQVLRELPQKLFVHAAAQFARILKPGGALYVRDHFQHHNPNQMPQDEVLLASGFVLEFRAQVRDRVDIHGIPRIWRRFDPNLYDTEDLIEKRRRRPES
jgi:SAM-dependent methyltransferase